ncbi:MAG: MaoC/PaaZ C-terminal domain-containing protein [Chloroflexota bacterium]|nr:MaoC/PaaZ C-terminal domain-containing protein [Chloroflexota bacterium]
MKLKTEKLEKLITENMVSNYANVSGDFNPIHLDDEYAKNTEFKNKIVHGMLLISNINEIMYLNFDDNWNKKSSLKIKFRSPLFVNSKLITNLKIKKIDKNNDGTLYTCEVMCNDVDGNILISGIASVLV